MYPATMNTSNINVTKILEGYLRIRFNYLCVTSRTKIMSNEDLILIVRVSYITLGKDV